MDGASRSAVIRSGVPRIHAFFLLLLAMVIGVGTLTGSSSGRGLMLWLLLLFAVAVREGARALAAAWFGLDLGGILLLPTGGLMTYATPDATQRAAEPPLERRMAVVGPIASIGFGILLALSCSPSRPESTCCDGRGLRPPICCGPWSG